MGMARIAELLRPYMGEAAEPPAVLSQLQCYLDLLLRWNARINLTAVRDPEEIVTRHFGESLFAAQVLFSESEPKVGPAPEARASSNGQAERRPEGLLYPGATLADVGSGAGFPGIPMKLFAQELALTLIESQNKKAAFLREVIRTLELNNAEVFSGRAEQWGKTADIVTLRAVEQFQRTLPGTAKLVAAGGKLCLLIGTGQIPTVQETLGADWTWQNPKVVPQSTGRMVLVGSRR